MATIRTAIQLYDGMSPALRNINRAINIVIASLESMEKVSRRSLDTRSIQAARVELNKTGLAYTAIKREIQEADQAQQSFNRNTKAGNNKNDGASKGGIKWDALKGVAEKASKVLQLSDEMALMPARLNVMNDGFQTTAQLQDMIFQSAQRSRSGYLDTAKVVTKLGVAAKDAFSNNRETVAFAELMNKSFKIGPGNAQEQTDAMDQLVQAMSAGGIQGDEIKSIQGNAPILAQSIENYMQAAGVEGTLEEWAAQGLITADVIKNAMFAAADETNAQFDKLPMTWSDIWTVTVNSIIQISQPLLDFINLLANNWQTLFPIILGVAAALAVYAIALGIQAAATWIAEGAAKAFFTTLLTNPLLWIALIIGVIIAAIYQWVQAVGGIQVAWLIVSNIILTAWDNVLLGFMRGVNGVLTFIGNMKVGVLEKIQDMANGAIDIINDFINKVNKIHGISINTISHVNFATTAAAKNNAAINARDADLAAAEAEAQTREYFRLASIHTVKNAGGNSGSDFDSLLTNITNIAGNTAKNASGNGGSNFDSLLTNTADIAGNTAKTADTMEVADEDLKYMRDLAEREVIDRTVLRDVNFELSNSFGDIRETADVDGIIIAIENRLAEAIANEAEGSYSV